MNEHPRHEQPRRDRSNVVIVRHACAGDKDDWHGADAERPLDRGGHEQAEALADRLAGGSVRRLLASPTKRCIDTLGPLAVRLDLEIETTQRLSPDGSLEGLLRDEGRSLDGSVMCTHGELMRPILDDVRAEHIPLHAERLDDEWLLSKGSAWRVDVGPNGDVTQLSHIAPLPLPHCASHADSV